MKYNSRVLEYVQRRRAEQSDYQQSKLLSRTERRRGTKSSKSNTNNEMCAVKTS